MSIFIFTMFSQKNLKDIKLLGQIVEQHNLAFKQYLLNKASKHTVLTLVSIAFNIVSGNIPLTPCELKTLQPYKNFLCMLGSPEGDWQEKQLLFEQTPADIVLNSSIIMFDIIQSHIN